MPKEILFFDENTKNVNKMIERILLCTNILPILFIVLTYFNIFGISYKFSLTFWPVTILSFLIIHLLNSKTDYVNLAKYLGLLLTNFEISYLATNNRVGIYIAFGFIASMSNLYYDKKLTRCSVYASYFSMLIAIYFRSFEMSKEVIAAEGIWYKWYIPHAAGYTIEFIFVFLISSSLTKRNFNTLTKLINTQAEQRNLVAEIKKTNTKLNKLAEQLKEQNSNLNTTQMDIIQFMAKILGSHDLFTGRHVLHTQKYVDIICRQLKRNGHYQEELSDKNISLFRNAAFLHDIGKIHIPEGVLNKMGKFTEAEFQLMQCHPEEGKKLIEFLPVIENGLFNKIAIDMAYCHHEKWDGTGYPNKISGTDIPLCARIMTAADVLDALISERLYKKPFSIDKAMEIFEESKGTHFEPCIADAVIDCKPLIFMIDAEFKQTESEEQATELAWWQKYHEDLANAKLGQSAPEEKKA